jgi:hypothetical protein
VDELFRWNRIIVISDVLAKDRGRTGRCTEGRCNMIEKAVKDPLVWSVSSVPVTGVHKSSSSAGGEKDTILLEEHGA